MPIYTFKCDKCKNIIESYVPLNNIDTRPVCKNCGSAEGVRRYFGTMPPVFFVGSGFYVNDSKKGDE